MKRKWVAVGAWGQVTGAAQGDPPAPAPQPDDELQRARYEKEIAAAEAARLKRELEEARKAQPSDEQRARWAELEAQAQQAEEERLRKAGEFEGWRQQINEKHARDLSEAQTARENERLRAEAVESELKETLVAREFADAVDLFGPAGRTVLLPAIAQSHFAKYVEVETHRDPQTGRVDRRVVVKDAHGTPIVDPKTGKPLPFAKAMAEVIDAHPQKAWILKGSGKVGTGSSGGGLDNDTLDVTRLRQSDFRDPKVRAAVRQRMNSSGGLQIGPGFDAIEAARRPPRNNDR